MRPPAALLSHYATLPRLLALRQVEVLLMRASTVARWRATALLLNLKRRRTRRRTTRLVRCWRLACWPVGLHARLGRVAVACVCARDVGAWLVVVWSRGPTWMLMRDIWHSVEASVAKGPREGHEIQQVMPPPCSRHALLPLLRRDELS